MMRSVFSRDGGIDGASLGFVDRRFFLSWSRCTFIVSALFGRCFLTRGIIRLGKVLMNSELIALTKVDLTGNPKALCMNYARFAFIVSFKMMALQEASVVVSCIWKINMRVDGSRTPLRITILLLLWTSSVCSLNNTEYP